MGEVHRPMLPRLYLLSSLQIGDMQSYVSRLYLYLPEKSLQLVFIVDNGPWTTKRRRSMPAELWQAMVTKSRISPFANRRLKLAEEHRLVNSPRAPEPESPIVPSPDGAAGDSGWISLLHALHLRCKDVINVKKPSQLYGCVSFEVAWADVRGINYLNELQTNTSVSLEVRYMRKREFDSLKQAEAWYASPLACTQRDPVGQRGASVLHVGSLPVGVQDYAGKEFWCQGLFSENPASSSNSYVLLTSASSEGGLGQASASEAPLGDATPAPSAVSAEGAQHGSSALSAGGSWDWLRRLELETNERAGHTEFVTPPSSPSSVDMLPDNSGSSFSSETSDSGLTRRKRKTDYVGERSAKSRDRIVPGQHLGRSSSMPDSMKPDLFRDCEMSSGLACRAPGVERYCPRRDILGDKVFSKQFMCGTAESREQYLYTHLARFIYPAGSYRDTFVSFRFADPLLPFELEQIITADQRLLKMLESGLPSWVIFLQSYPIVCHFYRPWMRPLASTVYFIVSIVTVLIGFYDLYKNVPVLKATAAHIFGPLAEWIDSWEMVSRLKYLGTMLFLQNFEKALSWILLSFKAVRQLSSLALRPVAEPLMVIAEFFLPMWTAIMDVFIATGMLIWTFLSTMHMLFSNLFVTLMWPIFVFLHTIWNLGVTLVYPIFSAVWGLLTFPIQLIKSIVSLIALLSTGLVEMVLNAWMAVSSTVKLLVANSAPAVTSIRAAKSISPVPSLWRTLWNDIFSKVFRAVKSIVQGLAAFSASVNRHRLSMYNNVVAFLFRMTCIIQSGRGVAQSACRQIFYHVVDTQVPADNLPEGITGPAAEGEFEHGNELEQEHIPDPYQAQQEIVEPDHGDAQ